MELSIIVDDREKTPWDFGDYARVSRGHLPTGDYALEGDLGFAVERKSLDDYIGTIASGWTRFKAELARMKEDQFPARIILIEADWSHVIKGVYNHSEVPPPFIIKRTTELMYSGVCVAFASNPTQAAGLCWRILFERWKELNRDIESEI